MERHPSGTRASLLIGFLRAFERPKRLATAVAIMEPIFQFVAFGLWTALCFAFGAVAGWLVRYCMETKAYTPPKSGEGSKPARNSARNKKGPASPDDSDQSGSRTWADPFVVLTT